MHRVACILLLACLCFARNAKSQIVVSEYRMMDSAQSGVVVHADPRLAIVTKKHKEVQRGVIRSGRGYRVQIYSGNDRNRATQIKIDFMRRYPGVQTYMSYSQPQFRLKVGNFRTRGEAQDFFNQVRTIYNPSMIVPDIIVINTLKDD